MAWLYFLQLALLKTSLLFFYLKIFPNKIVRWLLWGTLVFNGICKSIQGKSMLLSPPLELVLSESLLTITGCRGYPIRTARSIPMQTYQLFLGPMGWASQRHLPHQH